MATREKVTVAEEGLKFSMMTGPYYKQEPREFTVGPKCDQDNGRWICTTHDKVFANPMDRDAHCDKGTHVIAWYCAHHGPEVP
jgi:hypothetical protein